MATTATATPATTAVTHTPRRKTAQRGTFEYICKSLLAGGVAGSAAKTLIAPLDRVKILFQTNNEHFARYAGSMRGLWGATREIWQTSGARGLLQGHMATLLRIFPYAAIKFMAYEQYRGLLMPTRAEETALRQFWAGSLAGTTSVVFTYPMELVRVRMAYEVKNTGRGAIRQTCRQILRESQAPLLSAGSAVAAASTVDASVRVVSWPRAVAAFYRGFFISVAGMVPYAGASFCTHAILLDLCRQYLPSITVLPIAADAVTTPTGERPPLRVWAELMCGGLAGAAAQTISYPLEVIRRRVQVAGIQHPGQTPRLAEVARSIWRTRGVRGFFVGLSIGYIKVTPMVAVSFTVYDRMKWLLNM